MINDQIAEEENLPLADVILSEEETTEKLNEEHDAEEESRFKIGQSLRFVRVRFPGNSRSFAFLVGKRRIEYGQKVVAMSDRGMAVGYVNSFPYDVPFNKAMMPVRSISKVATEEDIVKDLDAYHQQKNAENICNDLIEQYHLDMHLTHVEFTSFGKKAVFYFIAPSRVDFRDLVKDLVGRLKTRIELRQISVRDRSAAIGGLGPCGRELCCSSFLTKYGNVGIKMAKNQDLTLNFSKLNGVCGQLKCCLQYEDEVYREKRNRLPREGDYITTHTGEMGRVDRLHLLSEQFVMMTNQGVRKRYVSEHYKDTLSRETANFPKEFESVSDETHTVIGLDESLAIKLKAFEAEVKTYKEGSKSYAEDIFQDLFGEASLGISLPELQEPDSSRARQYLTPDDEEELSYTPSEDELLPEDDDSVVVQKTAISSGRPSRPAPPTRPQQNLPPRGDRVGSRSEGPRSEGTRSGPRDDRPRDDRPRDDRPRDSGQRSQSSRNDRPRDDRPRDDRPQDDRPQDSSPREGAPRDNRPRNPNPQSRNRPPR
ncbi:MAG TPA: regulatory iron-sulfur-containing complex subunit RicT [Bacteriovoracaceae bacterium]|nr:regulatory iron-sulfur-containing complex subunit RicT [Bacteriovoracaceae bacterium]